MRLRCSEMSDSFSGIIRGALVACFLGYHLNTFTKGFILKTTMNEIAMTINPRLPLPLCSIYYTSANWEKVEQNWAGVNEWRWGLNCIFILHSNLFLSSSNQFISFDSLVQGLWTVRKYTKKKVLGSFNFRVLAVSSFLILSHLKRHFRCSLYMLVGLYDDWVYKVY